ncbi:MAG TPA: multicopper oxidase domain-containing protein [Streptosporangiaceae bacterium]|jgi:FtsP/CotA-like multicopper oxidase with cupredoxin domain|nr:multicopper oxidase domain-containing protein [Streptosporangiaceae bacterium]
MSWKGRMSRRDLLKLGGLAGAGAMVRFEVPSLFQSVSAAVQVAQTALPGASITPFVTPLTTFVGRRVTGTSLQAGMFEFQQFVLPDSFYSPLAAPFSKGTYLWGYAVGAVGANPAASYPGVTVEAKKGTAITFKFVNNLPANPVLRKYLTIDQTIHWADPLQQGMQFSPFTGPIPTVVHLHGGENQSTSDGVPEGWFTSNGLHGKGYSTAASTSANSTIYAYPNNQQATTLWFHDHALGITRLNVFSGLAAFYFIRDQYDTGLPGNPLGLPAGNQEIELMIQDRQFDTNGQLLFPDSANNPSLVDGPPGNPKIHPFWIPEFFGDAMLVNGRTWPYLQVEPRRYRFRIINSSNARFLRMGLADASSGAVGPPMYQIGTDGGLLDTPVKLLGQSEQVSNGTPTPSTRLFLAPAERADIIIDFANLQGRIFTLTNDAQVPFPSGSALGPADPTRRVMQFKVTLPPSSPDTTYNPASGAPLRGGANQEPVIVRLANPATGALAAGVTPSAVRQLVFFEFEDPFGNAGNTAGTPVEDLINNTKWSGKRDGGGNSPIPGSGSDRYGQGMYLTELPRIGSTEVWEFLNTTMDAHPIHIHLIQFQLINRQAVAINPSTGQPTYLAAWAAQFPGGIFNGEAADGSWSPVTYQKGTIIPGYGPPNNYFNPNADGALGGNPAFSPFLTGPVIPPNPSEAGWKDTVKVFPGYVNRLVIRWAPQATAVNGVSPGQNLYSFDPTTGPGYMVHCHILDHEDNEMMRPYIPVR